MQVRGFALRRLPYRHASTHCTRAAVLVATVLLATACSGTPRPEQASPGRGPGTPASTGFLVTSYGGCTSTGSSNCATGIQLAVNAAQRAGGGVVRFPAGRYLDDSSIPVIVNPGSVVRFQGAGAGVTTIVKEAGRARPTILRIADPGVVVSGLSFDSAGVSGGGAVVLVTTSHVTISHDEITGGPSTAWPLRFAGGKGTATPTDPTYATGNVVNGLDLTDDPPPDDDGLDFSFQEHGSISNVTENGSRLGLYVDRDVSVTNYHFTPNPAAIGNEQTGWYITAPSSDITITNFVTSGHGGVIGRIPTAQPRAANSNITIDHEVMTDLASGIVIGDVQGLVIKDSTLARVHIDPRVVAEGAIIDSTWSDIQIVKTPTNRIAITRTGSHQAT